ncbi:MAG TPA: DUF5916 domain-containing protein [Longimicrobiaceae bacterium]|nr:DUF5916 domain-containing protein [Longimicrobiaceae bacterium]
MLRIRLVAAVLAGALALHADLDAQARPDSASAGEGRRVLRAAELAGAVRLDGRLDEPAWVEAEPATDFTQSYPRAGEPARQRTEVRILYGPDALYVGARLWDTAPDSIAAQLARRDVTGIYSDWVHVLIDSYLDRRSAFRFSVNPRGVQRDVFHYDDGREDASWDAVWEAAVTTDSTGWTAEFRIPLSQLRFASGIPEGGRVWGLNILRDVARYEERSAWSPWTPRDPGLVSRFGDLTGLDGIRAPRRLEIAPYASTRLDRAPAGKGAPGDPFYRRTEGGTGVGVDARVGLPLGLTLTTTINPDFGQVEADPAEVNLTAFETYFAERRPFFTEGANLFGFGDLAAFTTYGGFGSFYSRRIGRQPQRSVRTGSVVDGQRVLFADVPEQTTIAAAAKVTGKTPGGWSVGLLNAVTTGEDGLFLGEQVAGGDTLRVRGRTEVEPWSNYFVGRLRRDLNRGATVLGGLATATHRRLDDPALAGLLRSSAYHGGVDWEHAWARRTWSFSGYLSGSDIRGERGVIRAVQNSPAHYFGRPDADYLEVDTTRTGLGGYSGGVALARTGGRHWLGSVALQAVSPGFEVNDLGFMDRADYRSASGMLIYREDRPARGLRNYEVSFRTNQAWNYGGDWIYQRYTLRGALQLPSFWRWTLRLAGSPSYVNDRLTRGGPLASIPAQGDVSVTYASDSRKRVQVGGEVFYRADESGEYDFITSASVDVRPRANLRVRLSPAVTLEHDTDQYFGAVARPADDPATFGRRYVFADIDQTTLSLGTRVEWTFTPRLSLQLYAAPYIRAGDYVAFKEFLRPGGFDFAVYGRDVGTVTRDDATGVYRVDPDAEEGSARPFTFREPDFTFLSLRGNAVLRWEYRPGSAVFLVWQQDRERTDSFGDFEIGRDPGALFREPARHVLLLKATYWIGR